MGEFFWYDARNFMTVMAFMAFIFLFLLYLPSKLRHDLHMLQQNSYRNERYRHWQRQQKPVRKNWCMLLPGLAFGGVVSDAFLPAPYRYIFSSLFSFTVILVCTLFFVSLRRRPSAKKPLVMTARAKRLLNTGLALELPLMAALNAIIRSQPRQVDAPVIIFSLAVLLVAIALESGGYIQFVNWLLQPVEKRINQRYLNEAKQILANRPGLKRVAITGSYGKTSCKMILAAMLSEQYIALATPESVNTPMGITRVIREQLQPIHQVFICEMGAKQPGDIAELCELAQPQLGILTAIGAQHLETFGSEEAIVQTKFELIRALPPDGVAVLNLGNEVIAARQDQAPCRVVGYGLEAQPYHAEDIRYGAQGVSFTLVSPQGERQPLQSRLLGKHNIENIVGAAAAAAELGLSLRQIAQAVRSLAPLPHRLQLMTGPGYTIIDDAFNSNPQGAAAALSVLAQLGEGQKILITPGMVELGEKEQQLNRDFARQAAELCDYIILVGKKHSLPLQEGLQEMGFPPQQYAVAADLSEARQILAQQVRPGDVVLFENDLPDTYNE